MWGTTGKLSEKEKSGCECKDCGDLVDNEISRDDGIRCVSEVSAAR